MDAQHRRLAAVLRQRITDGTYPAGSHFPSIRHIAVEHEVGLGTAYQAVAALRFERLLEGAPRNRLTVAHPVEVRPLTNPDEDWSLELRGDPAHSRVRADDRLAERLQVPIRTWLQRTRVDLLHSDRPAMVLTTWQRGTRQRDHVSFDCVVFVSTLQPVDAELLGLAAGITVLAVERTRYDADGTPVQVADLVLPADRWRLNW
jgi:DNA-binding GntR family transcriptional regulator